MPRIAVAMMLLGACFFDADYHRGRYTCSDGACPEGLTCAADHVCVAPGDAGAGSDATIDAPPAALTCVDPGPFPTTGGSTAGTTTGRSSTISATCGGSVMNGPDAVYRVDATLGAQIMVSISGSYPVNAYVIAPCSISPSTPLCLGDTAASSGNPVSVTASFAGQYFIIVDGVNPTESGSYNLTVTVTP